MRISYMKILIAFISCASAAARRRFLQDDVPDIVIGGDELPTDITNSPAIAPVPAPSSPPIAEVVEEVFDALDAGDDQVSVTSVTVTAIDCEGLDLAEDANTLEFTISSEETVVAEKDSYVVVSGEAYEDGLERNIWSGTVVDPPQADDEAAPRTISLTWSDCDTDVFLWQMTTVKIDGTTTVLKTIPCDLSATRSVCLAEVSMLFYDEAEPIEDETDGMLTTETTTSINPPIPTSSISVESSTSASLNRRRRLRATDQGHTGSATAKVKRSYRKLQESDSCTVNVDVMFLYTQLALEALGDIPPSNMFSFITAAVERTNQAMRNSQTGVTINIAHISMLPYDHLPDMRPAINELRLDPMVTEMRDLYQADLVQLISTFNDRYCGLGYVLGGAGKGYSLVPPGCMEGHSHTHELGHNFGCRHNREDSAFLTPYSHGKRYCDEDEYPYYRTMMSYRCPDPNGFAPRVNFFSNPDVERWDKPTGTEIEDNARTIDDNMVDIANYKGPVVPACGTPPTPAPTSTSTTGQPFGVPPTNSTLTPTPSPTYVYEACYIDDSSDRVLTGKFVKGDPEMTAEACFAFCVNEGSTYFGTEYSNECFCGVDGDVPGRIGFSTGCTHPCAGDPDEMCGGNNAISVYEY